jgi:hypothetical protein
MNFPFGLGHISCVIKHECSQSLDNFKLCSEEENLFMGLPKASLDAELPGKGKSSFSRSKAKQ